MEQRWQPHWLAGCRIIAHPCFRGLPPAACRYSFPFLEEGLVSVEDNRVGPLHQHVFPPALAPTLSFVGLNWKVGSGRRLLQAVERLVGWVVARDIAARADVIALPADVYIPRSCWAVAGQIPMLPATQRVRCALCPWPCPQIIPFPQFELQSRWIAHVLAGRVALPSPQVRARFAACYQHRMPTL